MPNTINNPRRIYKDKLISNLQDISGSKHEKSVFSCLFQQMQTLKIKKIHQCDGYWADGYLEMQSGKCIPIEIKETLGWPQLPTASFQIVSIDRAFELNAIEGWIIYSQVSKPWLARAPQNPLQEARHCLSKFQIGINIKLVKVSELCLVSIAYGTPIAA